MANEDKEHRAQGLALKTLIARANRPREEMAKVMGRAPRTLGETLSGNRPIRDHELSALLESLDVSRPEYDTLVAFFEDGVIPGVEQANAEVEFEVTIRDKQAEVDQSFRLSEPDIRIHLKRRDAVSE